MNFEVLFRPRNYWKLVSDFILALLFEFSPSKYWVLISSGRPRHRSVLFLHHSYYHFFYLARALRERGWDAMCVSFEKPGGINSKFYHGEDLNLFSRSIVFSWINRFLLFRMAKHKYKLMHFAGDGSLSFDPKRFDQEDPSDIQEWRSIGHKIAYTISGETSLVSQDTVKVWSLLESTIPMCMKCPWELRPEICSNQKNLRWGRIAQKYCDLIFAEGYPALDLLKGPKVFREPLTMCLDPEFWKPDLEIPKNFKIERIQDELLVYHAVGNFNERQREGRNIKGTQAVIQAVDQLKAEGFQVRLIFCTDVPNREVRYFQAQADIVVDQLNAGRYGANAREAMMLGKPTICYLHKTPMEGESLSAAILECPLISATEETIYEELKRLVLNPNLRLEIGMRSREYALKWHSMYRSAERYERVYDALFTESEIGSPENRARSSIEERAAASEFEA